MLVEDAKMVTTDGAPLRTLFARIETVERAVLERSLHAARDMGSRVIGVAQWLAQSTEHPVLLIYNARGASPLAYAARDLIQDLCPRDMCHVSDVGANAFGSRLGEARMLRWAAAASAAAVIPVSHFKISSRRFVNAEAGLAAYGDPQEEGWRLRRSWSSALADTKEYVPTEFLSACAAGVPIVFVDIPSRRSGIATAAGLIQTEKERARFIAGARDPYKLAPLLQAFGYRFYSARLDKPSNPMQPSAAEADLKSGRWCLMLNPDAESLYQHFDNRPQLCPPWGTEYSEYASGATLSYVDEATLEPEWAEAEVVQMETCS